MTATCRAQATLQKHQVELDALQIQGRAVKIEKQQKVVEQVRWDPRLASCVPPCALAALRHAMVCRVSATRYQDQAVANRCDYVVVFMTKGLFFSEIDRFGYASPLALLDDYRTPVCACHCAGTGRRSPAHTVALRRHPPMLTPTARRRLRCCGRCSGSTLPRAARTRPRCVPPTPTLTLT